MGKKKAQKKAVASDPEELKNLGNTEQMNGNFEKAIELYTKAIELCDTNAIFYSNRKNDLQLNL